MTLNETAAYLRRSAGAVRKLKMRRLIPFRKPGGRLVFIKEEIDLWIQRSGGVSLNDINGGG